MRLSQSCELWEMSDNLEIEHCPIFLPLMIKMLLSGTIYVIRATNHQENMSVQYIPPYTPPTFNSKTGVCRGIPVFLIFAPKHRLWVLVRTASARRF